MYNKNRRFSLIYLASDILGISISALIAFAIRFGFSINNQVIVKWYVIAYIYMAFIYILLMYFSQLYDVEYKSFFSQMPKILSCLINAMLTFFVISFFLRDISFSRLHIAYFAYISVIFVLLSRYVATRIIKDLYSKGIGTKELLIVGINENSKDIINYLKNHIEYGYRITGYLNDNSIFVENINVGYLGTVNDFKTVMEKHKVSTVLLSQTRKKDLKDIIEYCEKNYVQILMIPDILDIISNPVEIGEISAIPLIKFKESKLTRSQAQLKRLIDIIISAAAIIVLLPLFIIIVLFIKITSRGPVIFGHTRLGMNGKPFKVYKFRTMIRNSEQVLKKILAEDPKLAEEYKRDFKLKDDPRVTKIGNILRKTSMDELPQLINVLKGDMSIVGPRPIVVDELKKYEEYRGILLKIPPGITGMWQISGRNDIDYEERVNLDMYYINNWSLSLDIMIILKTIPVVFSKKGAY